MRAPYLDDGDVRLYLGDCIEVMAEMDAESVDAIVCDPPYGLEFMGKEWDRADSPTGFAAWCEQWAAEALRVLKPGGHLLAFGGTRTFHRLTCGIEDAGFEIRDCLSWLYGSGFPKSLDVGKAIDKAAGATRKVVGIRDDKGRAATFGGGPTTPTLETAPATDAAREWEGWGTALKPAWEPCVVARKPLVGTVAANVQAHGTGAINVDGCRIGTDGGGTHCTNRDAEGRCLGHKNGGRSTSGETFHGPDTTGGRWPANVALDEEAAALLDAQSGERPSGFRSGGEDGGIGSGPLYGDGSVTYLKTIDASTGGASRFYYVAKASKKDRTAGGKVENTHPTVKPTELMRWLVRMVTPPGGVVLDPFAGSGSTLVAAYREGVRCIGIEREADYAQIIAARLAQLSLLGGAA